MSETRQAHALRQAELESAAEDEGLQFYGDSVWDADCKLFDAGRPENAHALRMMIFAWRQGQAYGQKEGRVRLQHELRALLGASSD